MIEVHPFDVGPILGHVTADRAHVFGRGFGTGKVTEAELLRRRFGVVQFRKKGTKAFGEPAYCKMLPHFDFTGVTITGGLKESTEYEYRGGWFEAQGTLRNPTRGAELAWDPDHPVHSMRTASANRRAPRSFVFGSCRYLLQLFGGVHFEGRGDKTFRSIMRQTTGANARQIDALVMLGDQIYADDLNFVKAAEQVDEFLRRYRTAFRQEHLRELMKAVPTYMTLDDHEIEDNWPHSASVRDYQVKYPAAIHAYSIYQMSHSPLPELDRAKTRLEGMPDHFWYEFRDGCCDFFVLDVRTERFAPTEIVSAGQMTALRRWLADGSDSVKIIVSSVPLFPDMNPVDDDKWSGFLPQRDELLGFIFGHGIRRVLTLSGDVHASMSVELVADGDPSNKVVSVVSSPFYWPYPHPRRRQFQLSGRLLTNSSHDFALQNASEVTTTENFTRLSVDRNQVTVEVFGRKGKRIGETKVHTF